MGTYAVRTGARKITGARDTSSYAFKTEDGCCLRLAMSSAQASESDNGMSHVATGRVIVLVIPEREGTKWLGPGCCAFWVCRCVGVGGVSHQSSLSNIQNGTPPPPRAQRLPCATPWSNSNTFFFSQDYETRCGGCGMKIQALEMKIEACRAKIEVGTRHLP